MSILNHRTDRVKPTPCPCEDCEADRDARALATHLGLADDPDPAIEADARAADAVRWGGWEPILKRPTDDDEPDELVEAFEFPDEEDEAARLELFPWATEGGVGIDEFSPEEQENELWGESEWVAACKEHAQWMEEMEAENAYHEMIGRLMMGGFPADF